MSTDPRDVPDPASALARLIAGNQRFLDHRGSSAARAWSQENGAGPQRPFAIILGCSDSRTPVEILFDQGFGDLFVVRVAGNIVAPSIVGSIEFAASQFGPRLVVVLGHTQCGAIRATLQAISTGMGPESKNIRSITDRIAPNLDAHLHDVERPEFYREAVRANVRASSHHLRHGSQILEEHVLSGRLAVVGADYDLDTGLVTFFDGVPLTTDLNAPGG